tara:strand:- start:278 stop:400 length:123 start_codon:yes stop_codon:yes gene_type:complete
MKGLSNCSTKLQVQQQLQLALSLRLEKSLVEKHHRVSRKK